MRCNEVREKASAYMDNELDAAASKNVAHHIGQCSSCRHYFHDLQNVDSLVRGLPALDMAPDFAGRVAAKAREWDALTRKRLPNRTILSAFMQTCEHLFDLIERRRSPASTRTLDEFSDFPPLSMSSVYFTILGEPGRG